MNKIHRLAWSDARQTWIVTAETARSKGKPSTPRRRLQMAVSATLMAGSALAMAAPPIDALPTGGNVAAGTASISQSGSTMNINQLTNKAIINWNTFNIGSDATVNFNQPGVNAVTLNRVLGSDPSSIYGRLNATGQVFLINPNGVLFGAGARVDVGGLVASTLNIRDEDFLAGNYRFNLENAAGSVLNQGELIGKYIALLAPEVRNEGVITARMGTVALAAGQAVSLNITGDQLIDVQVDAASIDTLVENKHLIEAQAGMVILSAQSAQQLLGRVVNSGEIEAGGISTDGGKVRLFASSNVEHSGSISVDAGANGNGGSAILLASLENADSRTDVSGSITARGGSESGDGGFIETSGTHLKFGQGLDIDTSAAHGATGQWLLDPLDFVVAASGGDIDGTTLGNLLQTNNVTIQTTDPDPTDNCDASGTPCGNGSGGTNGDIIINDTINWSIPTNLILLAWNDIVFDTAANITNDLGFGGPAGGQIQINYGMNGVTGKAVVKQGATWSLTTPTIIDLAHSNAATISSDIDPSARDVYLGTTGTSSVFVQLTPGSGTYGSDNTTWDYYDAAGGNAINLALGSVSGSVNWDQDPATLNVAGSPYSLTYNGGLSATSNRYTFAAGNADSWTVTKALLTVTADDKSMTQGASVPPLTATITGFVNGENATTAGVTGSATLSTPATSASPAGTETITVAQGSLDAANYDFVASNYVDGTLTINAAPPPPTPTTTPTLTLKQLGQDICADLQIICERVTIQAQSQRKMSWQEAYQKTIDDAARKIANDMSTDDVYKDAYKNIYNDETYQTYLTVELLKKNGWTAKDFKDNGIDIAALKVPSEQPNPQYSYLDDSSSDKYKDKNSTKSYTAQISYRPAFSIKELAAAGYTLEDFKDSGFGAGDLIAAGYSAEELKAAGFSEETVKDKDRTGGGGSLSLGASKTTVTPGKKNDIADMADALAGAGKNPPSNNQ